MAVFKKVLGFDFAAGSLPGKDVLSIKVPVDDLRGWLSVMIGTSLNEPCCPVILNDDDWFDLTCYLAANLASAMMRK